MTSIPPIELALIVSVGLAGLTTLVARRRGGHLRGLHGWGGFWVMFGGILIGLSRLPRWVSFPLLALMMLGALRSYFSVAPVRPRDRYAVLAAYAAVPFALWPAFIGSEETFLATIPVVLFLVFPVLLSVGPYEAGLLDSMGRTLLGVLFFVFCIAHLGLLAHQAQPGLLELFGVLALAAEFPQRLSGRFRRGTGWVRPLLGILAGGVLAVGLGYGLGPWCGLVDADGARAGLLVLVAVTMGALVSEAVWHDLELGASTRVGRAAFLNRVAPAVYAAPVFFHYLNHFT